MRRFLCALALCCTALCCGVPATAAANDDVNGYRSFSFGLTSGVDLMGGLLSLGPGISGLSYSPQMSRAGGIVGINGSARLMIAGFQIGGQFGTYFNDGGDTLFTPGANFGYAFGIFGPVALTPSARALFLVPTAPRSSALVQITGELGLEWFLGKNGYMEPYFAVGALHATGPNQANFIIGGGYRLGIVFF
jgi:hypothetical protein